MYLHLICEKLFAFIYYKKIVGHLLKMIFGCSGNKKKTASNNFEMLRKLQEN
jgi:hypothetical protein